MSLAHGALDVVRDEHGHDDCLFAEEVIVIVLLGILRTLSCRSAKHDPDLKVSNPFNMRLSTVVRKAVAKSPVSVNIGIEGISRAALKALERIGAVREPLRRLLDRSCCCLTSDLANLMRFSGMTVQCFEHC